jgi:hypothetical protein
MEFFLSGVTAATLRFNPSSPFSPVDPPAASIIAKALAVLTGIFAKPPDTLLDLNVYVFDIWGFPRLLLLITTVVDDFSLEFPLIKLL